MTIGLRRPSVLKAFENTWGGFRGLALRGLSKFNEAQADMPYFSNNVVGLFQIASGC